MEARASLAPAAEETSVVTIPVSAGELIDKITILGSRRGACAMRRKRLMAARELALLQRAAAPLRAADASGEIAALTLGSTTVNAALWDVEDSLRRMERRRGFRPVLHRGCAKSLSPQRRARPAEKRSQRRRRLHADGSQGTPGLLAFDLQRGVETVGAGPAGQQLRADDEGRRRSDADRVEEMPLRDDAAAGFVAVRRRPSAWRRRGPSPRPLQGRVAVDHALARVQAAVEVIGLVRAVQNERRLPDFGRLHRTGGQLRTVHQAETQLLLRDAGVQRLEGLAAIGAVVVENLDGRGTGAKPRQAGNGRRIGAGAAARRSAGRRPRRQGPSRQKWRTQVRWSRASARRPRGRGGGA